MKTKYLLTSLLLLILAACQEEEYILKENPIRVFTSSSVGETRLSFTEGKGITYANWDENDQIGLLTETQNNLPYRAMASDGEIIDFVPDPIYNAFGPLECSEGEKVYAYYPYTWDANNSDMRVRVSGTEPFIYAKGIVKDNSVKLQFKHVFAYLKITITKEACKFIGSIINGITIQSNTPYKVIDYVLYADTALIIQGGQFDIDSEEFVYDGESASIYSDIDNHDLDKSPLVVYVPVLPQPEGIILSVAVRSGNKTNKILSRAVPKGGMEAGNIYTLDTNREDIVQLQDTYRDALIDLYKATDGDHWYNNENWCSDKPIHLWYGVNNDQWGDDSIKSPNLVKLELGYNGLKGTLPESFATLMDNALAIRLDGNELHGVIPEKVRFHPRWNEFGWNFILQSPLGEGFDMKDINLHINDSVVTMLTDGSKTRAFDILKKNKLTLLTAFSADDWPVTVPRDEFINKHLDFHNKGLGTVISVHPFGDYPLEPWIEAASTHYPEDIQWINGEFDNLPFGAWGGGSTFLLNDKGELIYFISKLLSDYTPAEYDRYIERIDSVCRVYLGEPEEHPDFSTEVYTSSDYTRDGEVVTVQEATIGKGIDLVFMGDAYVDRDMELGGKYETEMKAGIEYFFSIEPYKTFRDRFNVHIVKVISPNEYMLEGREHRINFQNDICFEYAAKIPNINMDKVTLVNLVNNPSTGFISGYTNMYESGASVAHLEEGGASSIIIHEAGGHGLGKLTDEYIYGGCEESVSPPENREVLEDYYMPLGHWGNIDFTNSPTNIQWAHFLSDERYKNEVGIYEGAYLWRYGAYRPTENSMMNSDYSIETGRFNAPSREAIYKFIMKFSEGDDWKYDFEEFATYDAINRNEFTRSSVIPKEKNDRQRQVKHRPPTFYKGSPRDKKPQQILVPLR